MEFLGGMGLKIDRRRLESWSSSGGGFSGCRSFVCGGVCGGE